MNRHASNARRHLSLESLESRTLMAGNVTASVINGSLVIQGDDLSNGVAIEETSRFDYYGTRHATFRVRTYSLGGSPTLLNGSTNNVQTFSDVTLDVNVDVGGSYDEVSMRHQNNFFAFVPRNVTIDGGEDADNVRIMVRTGLVEGGYLTIRNASVYMRQTDVMKDMTLSGITALDAFGVGSGGNINITGTGLDDHLVLDAVYTADNGNVTIDTGNGRDFVRMASRPHITGDVRIFMGDGEDYLRIGSLTAQNLVGNMGAGPSDISVFGTSNIAHEARFSSSNKTNTANAIDHVTIDGLHAGDAFFVWLSSGNDRLTISNTVSPKATLRGGPGFDKLILGEGNAIDVIDQTGFE
jgi:hypothetical protein